MMMINHFVRNREIKLGSSRTKNYRNMHLKFFILRSENLEKNNTKLY